MAVFTRTVVKNAVQVIPDAPAPAAAAAQLQPVDIRQAEVDARTRPATGEAAKPEAWCWLVTGASLIVGVVLGTYAFDNWTKSVTFTPQEGIGTLALFYIIAQTIERLQEPVARLVKGTEAVEEGGATSKQLNKTKATALLERSLAASLNAPADTTKAKAVANAKRTVDQVRANTTLLLFGSGSFLAMLAAGVFKSLLLVAVGVSGTPIWLDIAVTGMAIGGGTKPLHDLISNIEKAKEAKDNKQTDTP